MTSMRALLAYVVAVLLTAALATALHTQFVAAALAQLDAPLSLAQRLQMTAHDIRGMGPVYALLIGVSFAIALPLAGLLQRKLMPERRRLAYVLAGAAALLTALTLMQSLLGIMPIAGARSLAGWLCQGLAGAAGGWLFASLSAGASGRVQRPVV